MNWVRDLEASGGWVRLSPAELADSTWGHLWAAHGSQSPPVGSRGGGGEHAFQAGEETPWLHPRGSGGVGLGREGLLAAEGWAGLFRQPSQA